MSIFVKSGGWERASGPFWHAKEPVLDVPDTYGFALKDRGAGRPKVVAVYNPAKDDYRIKVFLDGAEPGLLAIYVDGDPDSPQRSLSFTKDILGPAQANVRSDILWRILQGIEEEDIDDVEPGADPLAPSYLDVSIEARFTGERIWEHRWQGDVIRSPEWMHVRNIGISPPETTGGAHDILLDVPTSVSNLPGAVRINGVWCTWMPLSQTSILLSCDLLDLNEIRSFGSEGERVDPETEPVPVQDRQTLHKLYRAVRMAPAKCRKWARAIETLRNKRWGMCHVAGQQDFYRRHLRRLSDERTRKAGYFTARYARRAPAYHEHGHDDWAAEVRGKPLEWFLRIAALENTYIPRCNERYETMAESIAEMRSQAEAAEAEIEEYSEEYQDAIRYLHKPR